MGICYSCFGDSAAGTNDEVPSAEMRAKQLAAAEKRAQENASRGIGNQAKVQQWQKHQEDLEKREKALANTGNNDDNPLRWQVN
ncbi:Small VCP/p97-interacting protein [Trinorchestia longiramus]|nr:Small VCP/p97-interacting protein [Trinorchestia longiramus]